MTVVLSASQLETWNDCHYKWGQAYLNGKSSPSSQSARIGLRVHKILEDHFTQATVPDPLEIYEGAKVGRLAVAMLPLVPEGTYSAEEKFSLEHRGISFRGVIDLQSDSAVIDFKTTSSLRYAKTEEELRNNTQAVLYAIHRPDVDMLWLYGQSKGAPHTRTVKFRLPLEQAHETAERVVLPVAENVLQAYEQNKPESLPKNKDSCFKYGRCHLFAECWGAPEKALRFYMTGSGLLAKLNEIKKEPEPEPDTINPPAVAVTEPEELLPNKKPRGRPKKTEVATVTPLNNTKPIRTLFCDCLPLRNGDLVFAHELIATAAATVCADMEVQNIKLIDFGKGGACLSAQLEADILRLEPGFDLALTTRTVEGREVYQTLMSLAQHIVVGL